MNISPIKKNTKTIVHLSATNICSPAGCSLNKHTKHATIPIYIAILLAKYTFLFSNGLRCISLCRPTDNNAITPGLSQLQNASSSYVDSAGNVIKNVCSNIPSGCEVTVDFEAKKDTTYWIKAIPTKGQTSIVGTSASIYVE